MLITFSDGTSGKFLYDKISLNKLLSTLQTRNVLVAVYLEPAKEKVRPVMLGSCQAANREGCEVYREYVGLLEPRKRPFTQREEQALKWAAIYQEPVTSGAKMFRERSGSKLGINLERIRIMRIKVARSIIGAVF